MNILKPIATALHPSFRALLSDSGYSPARELIEILARNFDDVDGNFVKDFQSTGFNARLWELYVYALLKETETYLPRRYTRPDFQGQYLARTFFVEAMSINPSDSEHRLDEQSGDEYFLHYAPLRYGGVLTNKLNEQYWAEPHVSGHPLIFAVQDFHSPDAMTWSNTALVEYLYGIRQKVQVSKGSAKILSEQLVDFQRKGRPAVQANFFSLPNSECVSAVLANPSATLSKFNRMGFIAGLGNRNIKMIRKGLCHRQGSLIPESFTEISTAPERMETWCEGLFVYHNNFAKCAFSREIFPHAAHCRSINSQILCKLPAFQPLGSNTYTIVPRA